MSQWKVGDGEYIPAHDMDGTTLLAKHNVPHTPTPSLSLYELSGQGHPFVHPTTPWPFDDQRRQKHYSTTNTESTTRSSDGAISYQQQIPEAGNKQLWTRQEKPGNKPPSIDYTSSPMYSIPTTTINNNNTTNDGNHKHNNNEDNNISYTSSTTPSSSMIHPLTNIYMDLHTDGSSVRIMPSQVIPPVTLPTNQNRDHRAGSQGMVALDGQQNSMKQQHRYSQQQHHHHQHHHQQMQQLASRSEHSNYDDRDTAHRATKHPYSRSFSDTTHSLLPYHHHSSQHRHNSIATAEHAAVRAAVVAAYQSHPLNSGQMTWYTQNSPFPKSTNPIYSNSATTSPRVTPSISKHPNSSELYQDIASNAVADGSNFAPMPDLLSSSTRMDNVDYGVHSSTNSTTTTPSTHGLGPQRHSNQWTSSSSSSSPRISDMHPLISMSFSPNDTYQSKDACTSLDQQNNDDEKHKTVFAQGSNHATMMTHSGDAIQALNSKKQPLDATTKKKPNKKSATRPQKPQTGKRRSPNAFFVFCSDRRQILKQGKPNARNTDINRQLGDEWKALRQDQRDWYKQKADRIRAELPNDSTTSNTLNMGLLSHTETPSITFTNAPTTNDGAHTTSDHHHHPTFDIRFNNFADTNSPASRTTRDNSMTIALDDDSVISDGAGSGDQQSKRGSLTNSDLSASFSSPSSQRPLNVASLSGAAEADALDQATLVGFHSSNTTNNSNGTGAKTERLKRPPNAYLLFNREMRRKLLNQNENLTVALISKLISQSWRDLPQDTKDSYIKEAAKLKQQHLEDHPNYVYSRRSRTELAQAGYRSRPSKKRKKMMEQGDRTNTDGTVTNGSDSIRNTMGNDSNHTNDSEWTSSSSPSTKAASTTKGDRKQKVRRFPDPRGRKKKKYKNPLGPKHPMSGFLFFAAFARPDAVRQHPKSNVGMISKVIAEQWKKLSDQDKQPWIDKAQADKARYAKEMEAFNLAQKQKELSERQQQQKRNLERMDGHGTNNGGYTNDASPSMGQMKKISISSLSSGTKSTFQDDHHSPKALSLVAGGSKESLDPHSRHNHMDYHHLHHRHHRADIDRHRNNSMHHYSKHSYKHPSRIHSVLASSRPASPTELDSHTIATVAQMVNPQNHTPVPIPSSTSNGSASSTTISTPARDHLNMSSDFHHHHSSNTPSLTSIMHHHHHDSNLQLHVPATPPSPGSDTM